MRRTLMTAVFSSAIFISGGNAAMAKDAAYHAGCGAAAIVTGYVCPEYKKGFWPQKTPDTDFWGTDYGFDNVFMPPPFSGGGGGGGIHGELSPTPIEADHERN